MPRCRAATVGLAVLAAVAGAALVPVASSATANAAAPVVTLYPRTGIDQPASITTGPDGALWFTNPGNESIGRITTAGVISNYSGPGIDPTNFAKQPSGRAPTRVSRPDLTERCGSPIGTTRSGG